MPALVTNGRPEATIVWWAERDVASGGVVSFAATELQSYIRKMSGAAVPMLEGSIADQPGFESPASALVIVTGDDALGSAQLPVEWLAPVFSRLASVKEDGFIIEVGQDRMVLAGANPRGTLYAAYTLLERLGVRFFAPRYPFYGSHAEYVPSEPTISFPSQSVAEQPSMKYRKRDLGGGYSHTAATLTQLLDWMAKARLNTLAYPTDVFGLGLAKWDDFRESVIPEAQKRGILLEVGGHGYESYLPESTYGEDHPDWFPDPDAPVIGVRPNRRANIFRITNEDALQTYIDNVVAYLKGHPEIDIFDAWPTDGALWTKADVDQFGSMSNAEAYVHGKLTDAVKGAGLDVKMEGLSYQPSADPPDPDYMYDEATLVDFATYDRSYSEPISGPNYPRNVYYNEMLERWRNSGFKGDTSIYEYYTKYSWHSLPMVLPKLISEEIPYYSKVLGADGMQIYAEPADSLTHELTHTLVAALSWNADMDGAEYVETYLAERYGPAAQDMATYLELVEEAGRALYDRVQGNYESLENVSMVRKNYLRARDLLTRAGGKVEAHGAAAFLIERLGWNLDYAIADTEVSYYQLTGEEEKREEANRRTAELVARHRLDGVILESLFTRRRHMPEGWKATLSERQAFHDLYRAAWE